MKCQNSIQTPDFSVPYARQHMLLHPLGGDSPSNPTYKNKTKEYLSQYSMNLTTDNFTKK